MIAYHDQRGPSKGFSMTTAISKRKKITPPIYAAECGISTEKVISFIQSGQLRAVNFATKPSGRPRYLIDRADIERFEASRAVSSQQQIENEQLVNQRVSNGYGGE